MKRFTEYLNEDFDPAIYNSDGGISIEDPSVVDAINSNLEVATACACRTPYNSLEEIRKVLAYYKIFLPKSIFLDQTDGNDVFEISQFGEKTGMNDEGEVVTANDSSLFVYFEWSVNERGMYDTFACVCDQEELDNILADFDSEAGDDLQEEAMPDLKKKMGAKKVTLPNMMRKEETLDEVSKKTLSSYIKAASHDVATTSAATGRYADRANKARDKMKKGDYSDWQQGQKDDKFADKMFKKSWNRRKGIAKAADKLAKEETINEISGRLARNAENESAKEYYKAYADETEARKELQLKKTPEAREAAAEAKEKRTKAAKRVIKFQQYADKKKKLEEANITNMQIAKAARSGDKALDKEYGYGTVKGGISPIAGNRRKQGFGAVANWNSAQAALSTPGNLRTKADAVHRGWGKTVDQMPAPEPKQSARKKLKNTPFFQLTRDEQEKDEVLAKAIRENKDVPWDTKEGDNKPSTPYTNPKAKAKQLAKAAAKKAKGAKPKKLDEAHGRPSQRHRIK